MNRRGACGVCVLLLAVAVFVSCILLGYLINVEFMVFAFPLFITTLMCGVKCMEPCVQRDSEREGNAPLNASRPPAYGGDDDDGSSSGTSEQIDEDIEAQERLAAARCMERWIDHTHARNASDVDGERAAVEEPEDEDVSVCVSCFEHPREVVFRKCGHMCLCVGCAAKLRVCPMCQRRGKSVKVFLA